MTVNRQEFEALRDDIKDIKASYGSIADGFARMQEYMDAKFARLDKSLSELRQDFCSMRLNFATRLDLFTSQLQLQDRGILRVDQKLDDLETRVSALEERGS